jgi:hypothetical protein
LAAAKEFLPLAAVLYSENNVDQYNTNTIMHELSTLLEVDED